MPRSWIASTSWRACPAPSFSDILLGDDADAARDRGRRQPRQRAHQHRPHRRPAGRARRRRDRRSTAATSSSAAAAATSSRAAAATTSSTAMRCSTCASASAMRPATRSAPPTAWWAWSPAAVAALNGPAAERADAGGRGQSEPAADRARDPDDRRASTTLDTAVFSGPRANYQIGEPDAEGRRVIIDTVGTDGVDIIRNIERLQFADEVVDLVDTGNSPPEGQLAILRPPATEDCGADGHAGDGHRRRQSRRHHHRADQLRVADGRGSAFGHLCRHPARWTTSAMMWLHPDRPSRPATKRSAC